MEKLLLWNVFRLVITHFVKENKQKVIKFNFEFKICEVNANKIQ